MQEGFGNYLAQAMQEVQLQMHRLSRDQARELHSLRILYLAEQHTRLGERLWWNLCRMTVRAMKHRDLRGLLQAAQAATGLLRADLQQAMAIAGASHNLTDPIIRMMSAVKTRMWQLCLVCDVIREHGPREGLNQDDIRALPEEAHVRQILPSEAELPLDTSQALLTRGDAQALAWNRGLESGDEQCLQLTAPPERLQLPAPPRQLLLQAPPF
jgi:hypothetical protein